MTKLISPNHSPEKLVVPGSLAGGIEILAFLIFKTLVYLPLVRAAKHDQVYLGTHSNSLSR